MKKIIFILTFALTCAFFTIPAFAYTQLYFCDGSYYGYYIFDENPVPVIDYNDYRGSWYYNGMLYMGRGAFTSLDDARFDAVSNLPSLGEITPYQNSALFDALNEQNIWVSGSYTSNYDFQNPFTDPDPPDPGDFDWIGSMWEWFLWQLGINDDYSGDIDAWITGGDREPIDYVTPTPSPPPPTPTPYNLDIIDPESGNPIYEITGIPGSTTIINGGDTYNGSDFDIFAVDLQIGDGGTSNPKDGLNSVMESSNEYLKELNFSPVKDSFSIIPSDWFLFIGVLAALPFIAGFIMRLLK